MANVTHIVEKPANASAHSKELPYWVAATTHNSVLEYRDYAAEFNISLPPTQLKLLVTNWSFQRDAGATPMWGKCGQIPQELNSMDDYIRFFIASQTYVLSYVSLAAVLKDEMDVIIGYAAADYGCDGLSSRHVKEIAYHELGHTSHYAQAGCVYWQEYRLRIIQELAWGNPNTRPYGDGTEAHFGSVGLGEMWGNHCQYIFTDRHYGNGGTRITNFTDYFAVMQRTGYTNDQPPPVGSGSGLNAYLWALENHNPNISSAFDRWPWIPQGLPYDLIDNRNDDDFSGFVIDNVSGYTNQQIFNALQSDVRSVPAFRNRLLQQNIGNPNAQTNQVNQLFGQYGY